MRWGPSIILVQVVVGCESNKVSGREENYDVGGREFDQTGF